MLQLTGGTDPSDDGFNTNIGRLQSREIDGGLNRNRGSADYGRARSVAHVDEAHIVPRVLNAVIPLCSLACEGEAAAANRFPIAVRRPVELVHILIDHALAIELRADIHQALLHALDPLFGNA